MTVITDNNSKNGVTYRLGLNKFSDLTDIEFSSYLGEHDNGNGIMPNILLNHESLRKDNYDPIDWRQKDVINKVKDQGKCGSCWAFSTVGPTEEAYNIKYGGHITLSEQ